MKRIDPKTWRCWRVDAAGLAACVAFTLLAYFAGIRPLLGKRADTSAKQVQLDARRRSCSELEASLIALKRQLAAAQQAMAESSVRLQPAHFVNQRVANIADLAAGSGLKIDDIQLGLSSSTSRYTVIPISLAGSGTYRTCMRFLHRLNQTFPDAAVSMFALSANPGDLAARAAFRFQLLWHAAPTVGAQKK